MLKEDYVSLETAKLLKEKGFDAECRDYYNIDGHFYSEDFKSDWNNGGGVITIFSAPTLQMAMKWLREVHNIIPIILTDGYNQNPFYYWFRIDTAKEGVWKDAIYREDEKEFPTYEEACEAAIKYCLENLA